jgi:hypothetical protein
MTLSIMRFSMNETDYMASVIFYCYAERRYAKCYNAECQNPVACILNVLRL